MKQIEMEAEIRKMWAERDSLLQPLNEWVGQLDKAIAVKRESIESLRTELARLKAERTIVGGRIAEICTKYRKQIQDYRQEVEPTLEKPALQEMSAWALIKDLERRGFDMTAVRGAQLERESAEMHEN